MDAISAGYGAIGFYAPAEKVSKKSKLKKKNISDEDMNVISNLEYLKQEMNNLYDTYAFETDPTMIDSYIYERMALNMRYKYYLDLCKERGIVANLFG